MEAAFQLKGRLFTLSVLQLSNTNLEQIDEQLASKALQAPKFFNQVPIVIDLLDIEKDQRNEIDLEKLNELLKKRTLIPVGFCCQSETYKEKVKALNLPVLTEARLTAQPKQETKKVESKIASPNKINGNYTNGYNLKQTMIIDTPIRSGQQIYASQGDLIVTSTVSPGAELLAEGSIHIYGTLRGRALAGINGNADARIFCHNLEADLISIAGQYRLFEDKYEGEQNKTHQIYLKDGQLVINTL